MAWSREPNWGVGQEMSFREIGIDLVIEKSLDFMLFEMETLKSLTITVTRSDLCL